MYTSATKCPFKQHRDCRSRDHGVCGCLQDTNFKPNTKECPFYVSEDGTRSASIQRPVVYSMTFTGPTCDMSECSLNQGMGRCKDDHSYNCCPYRLFRTMEDRRPRGKVVISAPLNIFNPAFADVARSSK